MIEYSVAEFRKNTREILNAVDQGAEVIIKRYENKYRIAPFMVKAEAPKSTGISGEQYSSYEKKSRLDKPKNEGVIPMTADSDVIPMTAEPIEGMRIPPMQQPVKSVKLTKKARENLMKTAGSKTVDSCEHGYAKGFCKKSDCNRKYQK